MFKQALESSLFILEFASVLNGLYLYCLFFVCICVCVFAFVFVRLNSEFDFVGSVFVSPCRACA